MSRTSAGLRQTVCHLVHQVDHILNRENARVLYERMRAENPHLVTDLNRTKSYL